MDYYIFGAFVLHGGVLYRAGYKRGNFKKNFRRIFNSFIGFSGVFGYKKKGAQKLKFIVQFAQRKNDLKNLQIGKKCL